MKIISTYVENFGKLNKFTYNFSEGLNIVEEENGWGKTTFAAFIKAMFYGLEYHRGKKITDRKLYIPWNGNKFGGYVIFEKDGIEYKIERFFGRRAKEDKITVYNMSKNTITDELGENPGEEIWKVDRDSYEKTAFITLDDPSLLNDIISSKLGDIKDQEADMETSSKAVELLDKEIVKIKAKRGKSGLLGEKKEAIARLKGDLRRYQNSLEKIGQTEDWIKKEEEELTRINDEISKIEEEQSKLVLYEKKQQHLDIINDFDSKKNEHDKNKEFFKEKRLSEGELNIIKDEVGNYSNQKKHAEKIKLSEKEKDELEKLTYKFRESLPTLSEIEECNENISALSNGQTELKGYQMTSEEKARFTELEYKYGKIDLRIDTIQDYLNDLNQIAVLGEEENQINTELLNSKENHENRSKTREKQKIKPLSFIGLAILLLGIFMFPRSFILGALVSIAGLIVLIYSLWSNSKAKEDEALQSHDKNEDLKERLKEIDREKNELKSAYLSFLESINENPENIASFLGDVRVDIIEYNRLKDKTASNKSHREAVEKKISELREKIELFLFKYSDLSSVMDYEKNLLELRTNLSRYNELSKMDLSYRDTKKLIEEAKEILKEKFGYYYKEFPSNLNYALDELTRKYYALKTSESKLDESKENREKFELENNTLELEKINLPEVKEKQLSEEILEQKRDLDRDKNDIIRTIERHKKDVSGLVQEVDKIEDIESEITQLEIDVEDLQKKHNLLTLTKECMLEAKENLAEKYMGDMSLNFKKYLKELNSHKTDSYQIDINLDVKVEHEGELYDGSQLSRGMKDLVQLCLRMALVESVYKDVEKPILVLDDPFINLDNTRLNNAVELLKKISQEYQIIYFICHNSRNIE